MSIKLEHSTIAKCSVESVWQAFTEVERWPEWSKLFTRATWIGGAPWEKGSVLLLEIANQKVRAEIAEASAPSLVIWTSNVMGVAIKHNFNFEAQADGTTSMRSDVDLSGPASFLINNNMKERGLKTFVEWFESMRAQAEMLGVEK